MKLLFQGKQVGKPRVRQYALLGNAWLEKESAILCPGCSPTSPHVMARAVSSSLWGLSPHLHTTPGLCAAPNPVLCKVINSCRCRGFLLSWSCQAPRLSCPPAVSNLEATAVSHSCFYPQQLALDPTEEMPFQNLPVNKCAKCLIISFIPCKRSSF